MEYVADALRRAMFVLEVCAADVCLNIFYSMETAYQLAQIPPIPMDLHASTAMLPVVLAIEQAA
jgi:hypothetical protein